MVTHHRGPISETSYRIRSWAIVPLEPTASLHDHAGVVTLDDIIVQPPAEGVVVDPLAWFDAPGPFELEIGSGKGGFLLHRARNNPDRRFLGIEWANQFFRYAADRMARWGLHNVRMMRTDAREFVMRYLPPACLNALHLYHPDPWPKKRHHKRRLVQPEFANVAVRTLAPGAEWLIQSDHEEYFQQMHSVLGNTVGLKEIEWECAVCKPDSEWSGTNYEIKYAREGFRIHRAAFVRV